MQLAKSFHVTKGAMTNTLSKLEASGYINIRPDWNDARKKQVKISKSGVEAQKDAIKSITPILNKVIFKLGKDKANLVLPIIRELRSILSNLMIKKTNKILIIGSAPDSVSASNWKNFIFNNIVVINNAWKIRKDWTNCIYPEDFPINKRPKKVNQKQTLHSADDYVKAQNHFGGFVYAGGTMAFTAGYWALYKFKPHIIYYKGCDMVYKGEKTHFYGKGTADPLRKDKTLKNLLAK